MTPATLIVAATTANGIGIVEGATAKLPWRLPKEMAYFARVTTAAPSGMQNAVVMGRRTWQSIPLRFRPLNHRLNVILSRNEVFGDTLQTESANTVKLGSLHDAMNLSRESIHRVFIIGGASVYTEALELRNAAGFWVDRILLTHIISPSFEDCNVFFPDVWKPESNLSKWRRSNHQELEKWLGVEVSAGVQEEKGVEYEYQMWVRESNPAADVGISTRI